MYKIELNLVRDLVRQLRSSRSPWGNVEVGLEFSYQRGRVDVLALTDGGQHLVAFEAKLTKWRVALHQAYRNTSFAHTSFVVLPRATAMIAEKYSAEFKKRNIGLCSVDGNEIVIIHFPERQTPIEPWLFEQAAAAVRKEHHGGTRPRGSGAADLQRTSNALCEASR